MILRESEMQYEGRNYIDGEWTSTETMYSKLNPSTGKALGAFPLTQDDEILRAVSAAREAFKTWNI